MRLCIDDTICAPATTPGTGAVSIIRVSGPEAIGIAGRVVHLRSGEMAEVPGGRVRFGTVLRPDGSVLDEVLVSVFRAPHSYTGQDSVEISCHASAVIASAIMQMLLDAGCRSALPGEFTRRAFAAGKMDLAQAEAVADVVAAQSDGALRVAMNQMRGGYSSELRALRSQLVDLAALMELELDFSEEDVEFADRARLEGLLAETSARVAALRDSFREGNAIRRGVPVAIVGEPNSGKSTLLNALLGEDRAIVSDIAGTTRDTVEETFVLGGVLYRFIDTAGIRDTSDKVEALGVQRSLDAMRKADVVICLLDGTRPSSASEQMLASVRSGLGEWQKLIVAVNKCDVAGESWGESCSSEGGSGVLWPVGLGTAGAGVLRISALTGAGLDDLRAAIVACRSPKADGSAPLVTNLRHYEALSRAADCLSRVSRGLAASLPTDLVAEDLRCALEELGSILGEVTSDEVLGEIFGKFCIGK